MGKRRPKGYAPQVPGLSITEVAQLGEVAVKLLAREPGWGEVAVTVMADRVRDKMPRVSVTGNRWLGGLLRVESTEYTFVPRPDDAGREGEVPRG